MRSFEQDNMSRHLHHLGQGGCGHGEPRGQTLPEGPSSQPETGAFPAKLPSGHPNT